MMRRRGWAFPAGACAALVMLQVLAAGARAGDVPVPVDPPRAPAQVKDQQSALDGHGWLVTPQRSGGGVLAVVLHVPPRVGTDKAGGVVHGVMGLDREPEGYGAWDRDLYIAMAPERLASSGRVPGGADPQAAGGLWSWPVQRIRAEALGTTWQYPPGRPVSMNALVMGRASDVAVPYLAGFSASDQGPIALMGTRPAGDPTRRSSTDWAGASLRLHVFGAWNEAPLPWQRSQQVAPPSAAARVLLAGWRSGAALGVIEPGAHDIDVWFGARQRLSGDMVGPPALVHWSLRRVPMPESFDPDWMELVPGRDAAGDVLTLGGRADGQDAIDLAGIDQHGFRKLTTIATPGMGNGDQGYSAAMLPASASGDRPGVVAISWAHAGAPGDRRSVRELVEVSVETGRTLFAGPVRTGQPLVTRQYQFIATGLVLLMVTVMAFVLRPESGPLEYPKGAAPSGGIRRIVARVIDLLLGAALAGAVTGLPTAGLLSPWGYVVGDTPIWGWLAVIAFSAAHSSVGESLSGQSLGKMLTRCWVINVRTPIGAEGESETPRFVVRIGQAIARNLVLWSVPTLGLLMFLDRDGRHPVDMSLGTGVIVEAEQADD